MSKYTIKGDKVICGELEIPVVFDGDVVVAGGGPGGLGATLMAGKSGYKTVLVEKNGFLGGMGAYGCGMPIGGAYPGYRTIGGVAEELFQRIYHAGQDSAKRVDRKDFSIRYEPDPEYFKYACAEMVQEYGAEIMLHSVAADVIMDGAKVLGIIVVNKSGFQAVLGKAFVDATGDADLVARTGLAKFERGHEEDGSYMAVNLSYMLADCDVEKAMAYQASDPKLAKTRAKAEAEGYTGLSKANTSINLQRPGIRPNTIFCNNGRVRNIDASNAAELTQAELTCRQYVVECIDFYRQYVPGMEKCYAMSVGSDIGVRESRRIVGEDKLTVDDCIQERKHPDVIMRGCGPVDNAGRATGGANVAMEDQHDWYDVPYGCIVPKGLDNIVVSGRSFSAEALALAASRGIGMLIGMSEAAGVACMLMADTGCKAKDVDVRKLQKIMIDNGSDLGDIER